MAVAAGFALRVALTAWTGPGLPVYITFYPAVMLAALLGGFEPGLLATALTGIVVGYWILPPIGQFAIDSPVDRVGLALFAGMGLFMSAVAELYRRDRRKAAAYDQETALRETRQQKAFLADVLERASQPFAVGYPDGRLGLCNHAYEQLTGYNAEELRAIDWATTLTPSEWRELERRKLEELHLSGQHVRYEKEYIRKDGTRMPVELLVHLVKDGGGRPEYYYSFLTDITRRKRAEEALRESRTLLQTVIEGTTDAIYVKDPQGRYLLFNSAAARATGKRVDEVLGQDDTFLFPPDQTRVVMDGDRAVMAGGKIITYEENVTVASGELLTYLSTKGPLIDGQGRMIGLFGVARDITERKRVEEALTSQRKELQVILESVPAMIFYKDKENHFVRTNKAFEDAMGRPKEKLQGQSLFDLYPKEMAEAFWNDDKVVMASRKPRFGIVEPMHTPNGTRIVQTDKVPYFDESGNVIGVIGFAIDITERQQIEEALRESQERYKAIIETQSEFVARYKTGGVITLVNNSLCQFFNCRPEDFYGRSFLEYIHKDERERVASGVTSLNKEHPTYIAEARVILPDGRVTIQNWTHRALFDANGSIVEYQCNGRDMTELRRAEEETKASLARLHLILSQMTFAALLVNINGLVDFANQAFCSLFNLKESPADLKNLCQREIFDRIGPAYSHPDEDLARIVGIVDRGQPVQDEEVRMHGDRTFLRDFIPIKIGDGNYGRLWIHKEITQRKQKETELHRLNRTLDALRHSSEAMMRAESEKDYLAQVCSIITNDCNHAMVWIGYAEQDEAKTVRPVAHAGFEEGYIKTLRVTWADTERGYGPTGSAIRTGKPTGCRNMLTDPQFAPWREDAIKRGYASSIVLPLRTTGKPIGAITIYSRMPDAFSEDEVELLTELSDDLSYGITAIRLREAHRRAEQALRQSEERNREELEQRVVERTAELHGAFHYARSLLEASLDPLVTISPKGRITDVNQATELVTGVSRKQLIGSNFSNYFTAPEKAEAGYQQVLAEGLVRDYRLSLRHASGRITEVLYNATVYQDQAGRVQGVFAAARDITERVAAEKRREVTQSLLELFAHKASGKEYFDAVVEVIRAWTDCQCLGIRVLDENGDIPYAASVGFDGEFLELEGHLSVKSDQCFCIRAISQSKDDHDCAILTHTGSMRCDNAPGFMRQLAPEVRDRYRGTCVKWGFTSLAVIPIRYRDQVLGAVHLADRRRECFPPATIEFLESMTPLIGEAIIRFQAEAELSRHRDHLGELVKQRTAELEAANGQLQLAEADLQRERDQLEIRVQQRTADLSAANRALQTEMAQRQHAEKEHKKLLRRLADAQENERARISRELHDQLGQELTALKLGLRLVKNQGATIPVIRQSVGKLEQLAGGLMQQVHRLAWELHPAVLDDLGLEAALRRYTTEWSETNRLPVDFHSTGMETARLPLELETALYRVTQEALTNILKHAKARRVSVLLERRPELVSLIVEDDGAGFDDAATFQAARGRGKLGLLGMQERITLAGGTIEIESTPGAGTTIFARIPWEPGSATEN